MTRAGVSHVSDTFHSHHQQRESTLGPLGRRISPEHIISVLSSTLLASGGGLGFSGIVGGISTRGFVFSFFLSRCLSHRRDNFRVSGGQKLITTPEKIILETQRCEMNASKTTMIICQH